MVGVPNPRKCHSCRKRKIKCDGVRPSCGQCRKGAIACEGYDITPVFKNQSAPSHSRSTAARPTDIKWRQLQTPQGRRDFSRRHRSRHDVLAAATSYPAAVQIRVHVSQQLPEDSPSAPMPLYSWSHDSLIQEFLDNMLPPVGAKRYCVFGWLRDVITWKEESDVTRLALTALATGWAGRADGRPELVGKGLQMYSAAAHRLSDEIPHSRPPLILATTGVLIVYELFEFGSKDNAGCGYHMDGAVASASAARSLDLAVPPFLHVFDFFRVIFMIQCFYERRGLSMAEMIWLDRPPLSSIQDDEFKSLVRLGFEGAGLLEMADALDMGEYHHPPPLIVEKIFLYLQKLMQWKESSSLVVQQGPVEAFGRGSHLDCGLKGFPRRLDKLPGAVAYDAIHDMRMVQMYHTFRLVVLTALLGNSQLLSVLQNAAHEWQVIAESRHKGPTTRGPLSVLIGEADISAGFICIYAQFLGPTAGPTFGYMFELWAIETAADWYDNSSAFDGICETGNSCHHYVDICRTLIPTINSQMYGTH